MNRKNSLFYAIFGTFFAALSLASSCEKGSGGAQPPPPETGTVQQWFTNTSETQLLKQQTALLAFKTASPGGVMVEVDEATALQTIDGFGYTLTGGSASLINSMGASEKSKILSELFGTGENSIKLSYLRLSIGASDLSADVFSYNDLPAGETDVNLTKFNLSKDTVHLVPLLKEILALNPNIKLMGSPWSAPTWMKSNGSSIGGNLLPAYYASYAQYFVKYIQAMKAKGITIDAVTIQNEPQHGGNNPSMVMSAAEQADFIKNHLGPAFRAAAITTKIIIWDHNCDNPNYPITILNDAAAKAFINGSAFHLYAGSITALSQVHDAHPDKDLYFTEQWTSSTGNFGGDLMWHMQNVMIGSMRNWSKVALEWNLANDAFFGPHTPGGCTQCKGALTIQGSSYTKNVSYYIIGQMSKFVPTASKVIKSTSPGNVNQVAFKTPDGKRVLVVMNEGNLALKFSIKWNGTYATAELPGGTVATYVW